MKKNLRTELEIRKSKKNNLSAAYRNYLLNRTPEHEAALTAAAEEYTGMYGEADFNAVFELIRFDVEEDIKRVLCFVEEWTEKKSLEAA